MTGGRQTRCWGKLSDVINLTSISVVHHDYVDAAIINGTSHRVERLPHALLLLHTSIESALPSTNSIMTESTISNDTIVASPGMSFRPDFQGGFRVRL